MGTWRAAANLPSLSLACPRSCPIEESTRVSPCCSSCTGSDAQAACSPLAFASWAAEQGEPEREVDADEPDRERNSLQRAEPPVRGVQQRVVAAGRREGVVSKRRPGV